MGAMMDKTREQFEAWCDVEGINFERQSSGVYASPSARVAWRSWQAATQAALVNALEAVRSVPFDEAGAAILFLMEQKS